MARILVGSIPVIGHLNPLVPIVRALRARGHEVHWYMGRPIGGARWGKPEVATRVACAGAGIDLRTARPTAVQVRNAVRALLAEALSRPCAQARR
ncbi:MAG TPA: hypothetical protein VGI14_11815 [Casimicrobiaceae bacterium]